MDRLIVALGIIGVVFLIFGVSAFISTLFFESEILRFIFAVGLGALGLGVFPAVQKIYGSEKNGQDV